MAFMVVHGPDGRLKAVAVKEQDPNTHPTTIRYEKKAPKKGRRPEGGARTGDDRRYLEAPDAIGVLVRSMRLPEDGGGCQMVNWSESSCTDGGESI
jgi:hypothetical protein